MYIRSSEILTGPHNQIGTPGETAYFICHARGDSVYWFINGSDPHPQSIYEAIGFSFSYIVLSTPGNGSEEHNNTITVEARPSNNSTRIGCTAVGSFSNQHDFQEGTLLIAGNSSPIMTIILLAIITTYGTRLVDKYVYHLLHLAECSIAIRAKIHKHRVYYFNHCILVCDFRGKTLDININ